MLLHIGYHKTATSWLQRHLFGNPDAGLVAPWSIPEVTGRLIRPHPLDWDADAATAFFRDGRERAEGEGLACTLSNEELAGNPHSGAFNCTIIAERLARIFPDARVLIVIRRQPDLLLSTYKQFVTRGGVLPAERYFRPGPEAFRMPGFRPEHFEFDRLIGLYHRHFTPDRVMVLPYEAMLADRDAFVRHIAGFAGGRDPGPLPDEHVRPSSSALTVAVQRPLNRWLLRDYVNPAAPLRLHRLNDRLRGLDRVVPAGVIARLERRLRARVEDLTRGRFASSNRQTAELTGLPLAAHGYEMA